MNLTAPISDKANALECLAACSWTYDNPCLLVTPDAHFQWTQLENCILVAARGSADAEDWINDASFNKITTIYGDIHTGFWRSYVALAAKLHEALRDLPALPVIVTGHSLGGAQAILSANDLCESRFPIDRVITFGQPRVGDGEFKTGYDQRLGAKTMRFVDARDLVPRLPFTEMGYYHAGQEGFLPSAGGMEVNPTFWELAHDDVVGMFNDVRAGKVELLSDHQVTHYQQRIMSLT